MRTTRASVLTAVIAGSAICAGPLVGVALAQPTLQSSTPANNAVITSAANLPTAVSVTYNEALNSPSTPVFPSHISVTLNSGLFPCTASLSADMKTLTCTPFSGTKFTDGVYVVTTTASPAISTGDTSASTDHVTFTVDTTPPQLASTSPADASRVQSPSTVSATYKEALSAAGSSLTVTNFLHNIVAGATSFPASTTISWTPDSGLPEGIYTASSNVTDLHGLTSTATWTFTVDNTAPPAPTVTAPTYINSTNDHHVPITGTSDNSSGAATQIRVSIFDGTTNLLTLPDFAVNNDGSWSVPAASNDLSSLPEKPLTISARAIDAAGNVSAASPAAATTKDTVAPSPAPSVTFPPNVVVNSANPTLHVLGTTEPDAGVAVVATDHLNNSTAPVTTTAADSDGSYAAVVDTTSLADGALTITATATDAAGNTSTGSHTINKDATPSGTPTISVFDPVNFNNKGTARPISGKATPGDTVSVWLTDSTSNAPVSEQDLVPVNGSGDWSTTVDASSLADGPITAHAVDVDPSSNQSAEATKVTIKDTSVPAAPGYVVPTWVNSATKSAVAVSGSNGEPGTTVHLVTTDSGAGTSTVDVPVQSDGTWTTSLDLHTFAEGTINFAATAIDQAGNQSTPTNRSSTKDTVAPSQPAAPTLGDPDPATGVVTATGSGVANDTVLVLLTSDGGAGQATGPATINSGGAYSAPVDASALPDGTLSGTVTETDPAGNTSPVSPSATVVKDTTELALVSTVPVDQSSVQNAPLLAATYDEQIDLAQSTVTLKDSTNAVLAHNTPSLSSDKKTISTSPANAQLAEGSGYQAIFSVKDVSGAETVLTTVHFTVDRTAPTTPAVSTVPVIFTDNVGSVPVSGTASEPGDAIHVTMTDGSHQSSASTSVHNDGTWSAAVDAASLNEGPVSVTATQTDAAGNTSPSSASAPSTKDTTPPAQPTLSWSGPITATQHSTSLSGTGEPGSTVNLSVDDSDSGTTPVAGQTTVAGDGSWSKLLDLSSLTDGSLTATAWQVDQAGNVGAVRTADGTKDASVPSAPTVGFSGPATVASPTVTLSGAGEAGDTVSISVDDADGATSPVMDSAVVTGSSWSKSLDLSSLSDGQLTATVTQTDGVGNQSPAGQGTGLKDATAPGSPTIDVAGPATSGNVAAVPVSGTGAAGDTIDLQISDGSHAPISTSLPVTAGPNGGVWSTTVDVHAMSDGSLAVSAAEVDPVGNTGPSSLRTFTKDTKGPAAPSIVWSGAVSEHALSVVLSGLAEPGSTVAVSVDDNDPLTAAVAAVSTADSGGSWSTPVSLDSLDDGTLTASASAMDGFGNVGPTATAHGVKDTVAPSIALSAPRAPFSLGTITARWRASDAGAGLAAAPYDVRWARGAHGKPLGSFRLLAGGVTSTSVSRTLAAGTTGCFEVRAHDAVGNVSPWTVARCSVVALDDSAMTASAGWTRAKDRRLYHGSAFTTTRHGATLTLPASAFDRAAIVATHCPSCGSIAIFAGSHRLKVIDLSSASTRRRVITAFGQFPFRTAELTIRVISRGKRVQIDGVGTSDR